MEILSLKHQVLKVQHNFLSSGPRKSPRFADGTKVYRFPPNKVAMANIDSPRHSPDLSSSPSRNDSEPLQLAGLFKKRRPEAEPNPITETSTTVAPRPELSTILDIPSRPTSSAENKQYQADLATLVKSSPEAIRELGSLVAKTPELQNAFEITANDLSQAISPGGTIDFSSLGAKALESFAIDGVLRKQVETLEQALRNTNAKALETSSTSTPPPAANAEAPAISPQEGTTFKEAWKEGKEDFKRKWRERKGLDGKPVNPEASSDTEATTTTSPEPAPSSDKVTETSGEPKKEHKILRGAGRFVGNVVGTAIKASPLGIAAEGLKTVREINEESKAASADTGSPTEDPATN